MVDAKVTVYGAYWCPDCRRSKKFLGEQFVPYNWVDIEQNKDGEMIVLEKNQGKRIIPTIVLKMVRFWWNQPMLRSPRSLDSQRKRRRHIMI